MRKFTFLLAFVLLIFNSANIKAQVNWDYLVENDTIIGWVDMSNASYFANDCDDCIWSWGSTDLPSPFGTNFAFYNAQKFEYFYFNTNGSIGINAYAYSGSAIPSMYNYLLQYGGTANGRMTSPLLIKVWELEGVKVLTMQFTYSTGTNITDYTADIQIHFVENLDIIEINYENVTGTSGSSDYCGINHGDGVHYTLIPGTNGTFPSTDVTYVFKPGYTDELKMTDLIIGEENISCDFGTVYPKVGVYSKGTEPQSNFDIKLYINDVLEETLTVTDILNQYDYAEYTFATPVTSVNGYSKVSAAIDIVDNFENDSLSEIIIDLYTAEVDNSFACFGEKATLEATGGDYYIWADPLYPNNPLYIGSEAFISPHNIYEPTEFIVSALSNDIFVFGIENNFVYVDHNSSSGDDRGGIAITPEFLYVVGDDYTVRMNGENLTSQVVLPVRDGIFSDLATGKLYTLYNSVLEEDINYDDSSFPFTVDAIAEMNTDLEIIDNIIMLSNEFDIDINNDEGGIFVGKGLVLVKNGEDNTLLKINIATGVTDTVGVYNELNDGWYSENWAMWGFVEEVDGQIVSLLFGASNDFYGLQRVDLETGLKSMVVEFDQIEYYPTDLHTITYSPWNNRIYYHSETDGEDAGYFSFIGSLGGQCWTSVTVDVVEPAFAGFGIPGQVCDDQSEVNLMGFVVGNADVDGEWSDDDATGALANNILDASILAAGTYNFTYTVLADFPCTTDSETSVEITVEVCAGIAEELNPEFSVYPNPSNGIINLNLNNSEINNMIIEITNIQGQIVYSNKLENNLLNLTELPSGFYTVKVSNSSEVFVSKLIIE